MTDYISDKYVEAVNTAPTNWKSVTFLITGVLSEDSIQKFERSLPLNHVASFEYHLDKSTDCGYGDNRDTIITVRRRVQT